MCLYKIVPLALALLSPKVHLEPVHTSLVFNEPIQVLFDGTQKDTMYVVEKNGFVLRVSTNKNETEKQPFLDISDRVGVTHDEEGLLSLAFHPEYATNGEMFVWYSAQKPKRSVLSRFVKDTESEKVHNSSEEIILEVLQPWSNHNGGTVLFGQDGYLYVGIGDGGAANDPHKNGQNKNTLLGSVICIDIDTKSEKTPYSIPSSNPLVGQDGVREELWAWGLRNPWRMSFDRETGLLWTGDVGQNAWEEIDIVKRGGNYGWNIREGKHEFSNNKEATKELIEPVFEYGRRQGGSITGGFVYRGTEIPSLIGSYIYSDYLSKRIWALVPDEKDNTTYTTTRIAKNTPIAISSFGETPDGEILACGFQNPYSRKGKIYRLFSSEPSSSTTSKIK